MFFLKNNKQNIENHNVIENYKNFIGQLMVEYDTKINLFNNTEDSDLACLYLEEAFIINKKINLLILKIKKEGEVCNEQWRY